MHRWEWLRHLLTIAVGGVFVSSGVLKFAAFTEFVEAVRGYALLPEVLVAPFALGVVIAELLLGSLLILDLFPQSAAAILAWFVLLFVAAMVINLLQGRAVECGCFPGFLNEKIGYSILLRDTLLLLLLGGIARTKRLDRGVHR